MDPVVLNDFLQALVRRTAVVSSSFPVAWCADTSGTTPRHVERHVTLPRVVVLRPLRRAGETRRPDATRRKTGRGAQVLRTGRERVRQNDAGRRVQLLQGTLRVVRQSKHCYCLNIYHCCCLEWLASGTRNTMCQIAKCTNHVSTSTFLGQTSI